MLKVLKPSQLKTNTGKVLDAAKSDPQYIVRDGVLLVLQRLNKLPSQQPAAITTWDALASGTGLDAVFLRMSGRARAAAEL